MVSKFFPEINKVYFINQYSLFQIISGHGSIEVDFKHYYDWQNKIIYLEKGQYIKFLSDDFEVKRIVFNDENVFRNKEVRVLFKHLVSLGYINLIDCDDCSRYLNDTILSKSLSEIIDISSKQWFWQNPFHANKDEYHIIFDVKEVIDSEYKNHLTNSDLASMINGNGYKVQALVKDKIGLSVKGLLSNKRLLETKKNVAFTDKTIQEVSYDHGFKDAAYFTRQFKLQTGKTPVEFRNDFGFEDRDHFVENIIELLRLHHTQERSLEFYANKMHLSVKALSKNVRSKMNTSLGKLIRLELVNTAKSMLQEGGSSFEVAHALGFEEPNHFSTFFKKHTNITPTEYLSKKYNF